MLNRIALGTSGLAACLSLALAPHKFAHGQSLNSPLSRLERPDFARGMATINPFDGDLSTNKIMNQFGRGQLTLDQAVSKVLYSRLLNFGIEIRSRTSAPSFGLHGLAPSRDYRFFANNIEFCRFQVRAHEVAGASPALMGTYPDLEASQAPILEDWPSLENTLATIDTELTEQGITNNGALLYARTPCILSENNHLIAVWNLHFRADGRSYRALADDVRTYEFERGYFDVDGMAKVYERNPKESQLKEFTLTDLTGDGKLSSTYFTTKVTGVERANQADHKFVFQPSDLKFDEASTFTHASEMIKWFLSLGYDWKAGKQIVISLHNPAEDLVNNAQYDPGGGSVNPQITIGDGDGSALQNLPKDADVVSHELGHHVIYRTLTSTSGESLVLHEGIADFFAFAHAGDACLGESICPANSPYCAVKAKCLRTADNTYKYGSATLPEEAHQRSQFISGMLWDIRKANSIPSDDLTKLVLKSLDYLLESSGYHDFILSMMIADKNIFGGAHGCKIVDAAKARGLTDKISDIDCTKELPTLVESTTDSTTSTTSQKRKSSKQTMCGIVSTHSQQAGSAWFFLVMILAVPVVLSRKQAKQRG